MLSHVVAVQPSQVPGFRCGANVNAKLVSPLAFVTVSLLASLGVYLAIRRPRQISALAFAGVAIGNAVFFLGNFALAEPGLSLSTRYVWQRVQQYGSDIGLIAAVFLALSLHKTRLPRWVKIAAALGITCLFIDLVWLASLRPDAANHCTSVHGVSGLDCEPGRDLARAVMVVIGMAIAGLFLSALRSATDHRQAILRRYLSIIVISGVCAGVINNIYGQTGRLLFPSEIPILIAAVLTARMLIVLEEDELGAPGYRWGVALFLWILALVVAAVVDQLWLPSGPPILTVAAASIGLAAVLAYVMSDVAKMRMGEVQERASSTSVALALGGGMPDQSPIASIAPLDDKPQPTANLCVYLFGDMRVVLDGTALPMKPKAWRSSKTQSLLAYLILKGPRGATQVEIMDSLWPLEDPLDGEAERRSSAAVRSYLSTLRRVLDPQGQRGSERWIVHEGDRYTLRTNDLWVDVWEFERLAQRAKVLVGQNRHEDGRQCWRQAMALYDPMGLLPHEAHMPVSFLEPLRERLHQRWVVGLRFLARNELDPTAAAGFWETIHQTEPLDEDALDWLARHYKDSGNISALRALIQRRRIAELELAEM